MNLHQGIRSCNIYVGNFDLCSETIEPGDSAGLWQETRSTYDTFGTG